MDILAFRNNDLNDTSNTDLLRHLSHSNRMNSNFLKSNNKEAVEQNMSKMEQQIVSNLLAGKEKLNNQSFSTQMTSRLERLNNPHLNNSNSFFYNNNRTSRVTDRYVPAMVSEFNPKGLLSNWEGSYIQDLNALEQESMRQNLFNSKDTSRGHSQLKSLFEIEAPKSFGPPRSDHLTRRHAPLDRQQEGPLGGPGPLGSRPRKPLG